MSKNKYSEPSMAKPIILRIGLAAGITGLAGILGYCGLRTFNDAPSNQKENLLKNFKQDARRICEGYSGGATSLEYRTDRAFSEKAAEANRTLSKATGNDCKVKWYCDMPAEGNGLFKDRGIECKDYK